MYEIKIIRNKFTAELIIEENGKFLCGFGCRANDDDEGLQRSQKTAEKFIQFLESLTGSNPESPPLG